MRAVHRAGQLTAGLISAEHRRLRRLFATLDDVGHDTSSRTSTWMVAQCWDRISELVLQTGDAALARGVRAVGEHEVGSPAWWRAVGQVAAATDAHFRRIGAART